MSDETVRVPAALVEALRHAVSHGASLMRQGMAFSIGRSIIAAVDAAERPDEGEHRCKTCGLPDGPDYGDPHECPPGFLPVGEPLCKCGHPKSLHNITSPITPHCMGAGQVEGRFCWCSKFKQATARDLIETTTPAPLSSPRRTRDEGITLTDEELERLWYDGSVVVRGSTVQRLVQSIIAARLAGEDDRHE